jgi:peptide chain release factor 2
MYSRYFSDQGWDVEVVDETPGTSGGYGKLVLEVSGENVYGKLKFESGAHRVQRVPETEAKGRVHTSAATVVVLPKMEPEDINIRKEDIRTDTFRASGAGGQHVNKTESAVRVRHLPSGIVVECQEERSQHQNREKAMQMLRSELYKMEIDRRNEERDKVEAGKMKIEWGSQIRSYVLDDKRIKDHRSNHQTHNIKRVLDGDIDDFLKATLMAMKQL